MRTTRTIICIFVAVFVAIFATSIFAQSSAQLYKQLQPYKADFDRIHERMMSDHDDSWFGDWRFRAEDKVNHERKGWPLHPTKDLYEWLQDTREVFKEAEGQVSAKGAKELLTACQKVREAGIVFYACYYYYPREVCLWAHSGPFFGRDGSDDKFMVQIFCVKACNSWEEAYKEYSKVYSRSSEQAKFEVLSAVFKVRGKTNELEYCQKYFAATKRSPQYNDFPRGLVAGYFYFFDVCSSRHDSKGDGLTVAEDIRRWNSIFKNLSDPVIKECKREYFSAAPRLTMNGCDGLREMLPKGEFVFLWQQAEEAFTKMLKGPSEDLPRYEYWKRDQDSAEPTLVLKVLASFNPYRDGRVSGYDRASSPVALFEEICPEWKHALISPDAVSISPDDLYLRYFAEERLKWHRISAEEYVKLKAYQEEWIATNPGSAFIQKQRACADFEKGCEALATTYRGYEPGQTVENNRKAFRLSAIQASAAKAR